MDLLIHGVFDAQTLKTLHSLNVSRIGFDLRGKSLNLIPFHVLKSLIPNLKLQQHYLTFENDKLETVLSFLNLLGEDKNKFYLEFRDQMPASYYASINHPFVWFFHPEADWQNILHLPLVRGIILPVKFQSYYQGLPKFWHMVQELNIPVILHVDSFSDLELYVREKNLTLSVDLGRELESGFRKIDQARLQNLSIWRNLNETFAGQ